MRRKGVLEDCSYFPPCMIVIYLCKIGRSLRRREEMCHQERDSLRRGKVEEEVAHLLHSRSQFQQEE